MSAKTEIDAAKANLDHAKHEYEKELRRIIEQYHPVQVGEVIVCNGFSHTGKKFRVKGRNITYGNAAWLAIGPILKKDGSESLNEGEWRQRIT